MSRHSSIQATASHRSGRGSSLHKALILISLLGLILIPTFAGQLLLFRVLHLYGSRKLSIVTYLMPAFAVVYGAILLSEEITVATVI